MDAVLLYSTWPSIDSATNAARLLIEQRLAACANIIPGASVFRWNGEIQTESEAVMMVKTSAEKAAQARDAIRAQHPYELPCITAVKLDGAFSNPDFISWIMRETE